MENYTIKDIEQLTEQQAADLALETMDIKEHQIYLIDFGGYFGYSACVFKNGHHIHYANDYELHHNGKTQNALKQLYIDKLNRQLFTDAEFAAPLKDYDEYRRKTYFLNNLYAMRVDHVSIFGNFNDKKIATFYDYGGAGYLYKEYARTFSAPRYVVKVYEIGAKTPCAIA